MNVVVTVALTIVGAYVLAIVVLWRFQERVVFQPPRFPDAEPADGVARFTYVASDGTGLIAHVVGTRRGSASPVLAFHGNAVVARWLLPWAREVAERFDTCVILPEFRGYDGLEGTPTYPGVALDAEAALQATCIHLGVNASDVVIFGHSLGSAVAAELAARASPRALVLQSPFSSARGMVARWRVAGAVTAWGFVARVHYDTVARVRVLESPVFVAHGKRDVVIPARMGREVFAAARTPARRLIVPSAGHNNVPEAGGADYWRWLGAALGQP